MCGSQVISDLCPQVSMPHQWLEGNLPVSAKCNVCDKTCGSVLRLQDWRCLWCKAMVSPVTMVTMESQWKVCQDSGVLSSLSCRCTQAVRTSCPPSVLWDSVRCPSSRQQHSTASTLMVRFILHLITSDLTHLIIPDHTHLCTEVCAGCVSITCWSVLITY